MQIIIPMTGYGSRFVAAGYKNLKPFIEVEGKTIIEWIVKRMYPNEKNILFVCRKEHLNSILNMEDYLKKLCPTAKIFAIDNWIKNGPVYDVLLASNYIADNEQCIINYCDVYMIWNYEKFVKDVTKRGYDGAIPCYTGFHPHLMVKKNVFASCLTDENDNLIEIREKFSYEKDKTKAKHSAGVYYFKDGRTLKKYCQKLIDANDRVNGEFYASLPYNYLVKDGKKVWVPLNIEIFCQWGTPEDMRESIYWLNIMKGIKNEYTNTNGGRK